MMTFYHVLSRSNNTAIYSDTTPNGLACYCNKSCSINHYFCINVVFIESSHFQLTSEWEKIAKKILSCIKASMIQHSILIRIKYVTLYNIWLGVGSPEICSNSHLGVSHFWFYFDIIKQLSSRHQCPWQWSKWIVIFYNGWIYWITMILPGTLKQTNFMDSYLHLFYSIIAVCCQNLLSKNKCHDDN